MNIFDSMEQAGGDVRDMSPQQLTEARKVLDDNLFYFAWYVFDYKDLIPSLHGKLATLLGMWGSEGNRRLMVQIPREFFKTSLCTRANTLWQVCKDPDEPVAIFNERLENASKWLRAIRDVVQSNVIFQEVYRDLLPPGIARNDDRSMPRWWKWSDAELNFQRGKHGIPEASVTALGIGAAAAGGHWPKTIKDDLISEDAARSPSVMQHSKDWFDKSLYLERPALKGMDLVVCTRWAYDDLYTYVAKQYDYKVYRRAALEDGVSIFPEKLTTEELLKQQSRDPYGFSSQMMNEPMPGREMNFDLGWLRWFETDMETISIERDYYDPNINPTEAEGTPPHRIRLEDLSIAILLDPAPSEESDRNRNRNARNGIVVVAKDRWGRRFVLDCWAERVDPLDVMHKLFQLMQKWGTNQIGIEEVNFSLVYRHWLRQLAKDRKVEIRTMRLKPQDFKKMNKDTRISAKIPDFRAGYYYFNRHTTQKLVQEYVEFPYGGTRDLMDALAYDVRVRTPLDGEAIMRDREEFRVSTADPVTGY